MSAISEADNKDEAYDALYDLQSVVIHKGEYGSGMFIKVSLHCKIGSRRSISNSSVLPFIASILYSGHYYSYVRPDIRTNDWYRFDDSYVTKVDYSDVVADAFGGRARRKRSRSVSYSGSEKRRRGFFRRMFSFGRSRSARECGFGYGGRSSSAYMLQYAKRSDIPTLYLENDK